MLRGIELEAFAMHCICSLTLHLAASANVLCSIYGGCRLYTEDGCVMCIQASPAVLGRLMAGGALPVTRDE